MQITLPEILSPTGKYDGNYDETSHILTIPVLAFTGQVELATGNSVSDATLYASLLDGIEMLVETKLHLSVAEQFSLDAQGGEIVAMDGTIQVEFPKDALPAESIINIGKPSGDAIPPYSLSGQAFEINVLTQEDQKPVEKFDQYITLAVSYADLGITENQLDNLRIAWYNETTGDWEHLPSSIDPENQTIYAVTDHLTVFDIDATSWQAAHPPSIEAFQVSNFTGAATYSLPIEVPPGPGGLQPSLVLTYNSQIVDESTAETQASWVGMGWSLDTGSIERFTNGTNGTADDTFFLNVNGISSRIVRDTSGVYHLGDENFWKMTYNGGNPSSWVLQDKSGNTYTFGATSASVSTMVYNAGSEAGCGDPDIHTVDYRWELTRVTNIFGQQINYDYTKESKNFLWASGSTQPCQHHSMPTDTATYPKTIQYGDNRYQVYFELGQRYDYKSNWATDGDHYSFMKQRLTTVYVKQDSDTNGTFETIIRKYILTYLDNTDSGIIWPGISWTAGGKNSTLAQVQQFGVGGTNFLPAATFTYGDNMHLTLAKNGYGGQVQFVYEMDAIGSNTIPWYYSADARYRYTRYDRVGLRAQQTTRPYWPAGSCWNNANSKWSPRSASDYAKCESETGLVIRGTAVGSIAGNELLRPGGAYKIEATFWSGFANTGIFDGSVDQMTQGGIVLLPKNTSKLQPILKSPNSPSAVVATVKLQLLPAVYRVMTRKLSDGNGNIYEYTYSYNNPAVNDETHSVGVCPSNPFDQNCYEYVEKYSEFRGHGQVTETGPDGMQTVMTFYQDDLFKGRPIGVTIKDGTNVTHSSQVYGYASTPLAVSSLLVIPPGSDTCNVNCVYYIGVTRTWKNIASVIQTIFGSVSGSTKTTNTYESNYGNLTDRSEYEGNSSTPYRSTHFDYYPNATSYLVGLPARQQVKNSAGTVIAESLNIYDSNTTFDQVPTAGKLSATRTWVSGTDYAQTSFGYDAWGNRTTVTTYTGYGTASAIPTAGAATTTTVFDPVYHAYPLSTTNALLQTTFWTYDYGLGVPLTETDPNDNTTSAQYDVFGRMTKMIRPGDDSNNPTLQISYNDMDHISVSAFITTITQKIDSTPRYYTIQRTYDGMGRQTKITSGGVSVDTVYQSATVTKQSVPYEGTSPNLFTTTTINPSAHTTTVQAPDGTSTISLTDGLVTTVTDGNSHSTTSTSDVWGRVVSVAPHTGPSVTYTYDELDHLKTATRGGVSTTLNYDNSGRKTFMSDPDMGDWSYAYDALGNLTRQTDARGNRICLYYDSLNRLIGKHYRNDNNCPTSPSYDVSFGYDSGTSGKGRRTSMSDSSGSTAWIYDARGRTLSESRNITGAGTFNTSWTYNSADLPVTMTYLPGRRSGNERL